MFELIRGLMEGLWLQLVDRPLLLILFVLLCGALVFGGERLVKILDEESD